MNNNQLFEIEKEIHIILQQTITWIDKKESTPLGLFIANRDGNKIKEKIFNSLEKLNNLTNLNNESIQTKNIYSFRLININNNIQIILNNIQFMIDEINRKNPLLQVD